MLISCFQCRQQLDVPEDSSGKRVRCPHCQYVIVVPTNARPAQAEGIEAPTTALPSMELDAEADKPAPVLKLPAQPLPPFDLPPTETWKSETHSPPPIEDLPPVPSIDRSKRRRAPMSPLPPARAPWGRIVGIGTVVGLIVIGVIVAVFSSRENRRRRQPPPDKFAMPPPVQMQPFKGQRFEHGGGPILNFQNPPPLPAELWRNVQFPEHRFKAQFPGQPLPNNQNFNFPAMTVFSVRHPEWEFDVAHGTLTEKQYLAVAEQDRFRNLARQLCNNLAALEGPEKPIVLAGVHPGREWELVLPDNRIFYVRTYYVRTGNTYHHYLLTAKGPMNTFRDHADINRFFDGFGLLDGSNRMIFEELDALGNGGRRDDEFTAMALHPQELFAVSGSVASRLKLARLGGAALKKERKQVVENFGFTMREGKAIEQMTISQDGQWLAVSVAGEIQYWQDWTNDMLKNKTVVKGSRCAFTKNHHLLVATKDGITEYETFPNKLRSTLPVPNLAIKGFALSADDRTLAVFGEKAIELWQWQEKELLGRIDAHDAPVTAVAFAPDGKTLASASADRTVKLWHVDTRAEHATLRQHAWTVWALAFTPDGKHLASGGLDGMLLLWDLGPDQPCLVWAQAHQFPVRAVAFDNEGKHLYLTCKHPAGVGPAGNKQYVRQLRKITWADMKPNPQEAERVVAQQAGLHLPATSTMAYFSPDGQTFVTMTDGIDKLATANSLRVWDTATATLGHAHGMDYIGVLSPDGKWFVFARFGGANQIQLLEVQTNRVTNTVVNYPGPDFPQVMFTHDSKSLWVRRNNDFVRYEIVLEKDGGPVLAPQQPLKLKQPNDPRPATIFPSLDHKTFLVERISLDGLLRTRTLYSSADGKELPLPKSALGRWSAYLRLRRVEGGRLELDDFLNQNTQTIGQQRHPMNTNPKTNTNIFAIHPERKYAATTEAANNQTTLRTNLWDLEERRPLLTLPEVRARTVNAIHFSPDGRLLALVGSDSSTRIVPMEWLLERKALLPCPPNDVVGP
jgi:WD40 repeat protein/DNA-directed RNA polymerase subunit RPC12/RpoP